MFRSHHRYLLMTAAGLTAWQWRKGHLIQEGVFDAGRLPAFEDYLRHHAQQSFFMLVDIPDEAFRIDEIPHVNQRDGGGICRRRLERHFPGVPLATAIPLKRSQTGRRDDRFLFCALTPSLDPWMAVLRRTASRLAGVFSLFQAMTSLAKQRGIPASPCLMISVTEEGLRQTFFRDGLPCLSRLTRRDSEKSLQDALVEESEKMRQYLAGQLGCRRDECLPIFVLAHSSQSVQGPFVFWKSEIPVEQALLRSLVSSLPPQQFASGHERRFYRAAWVNRILKGVGSLILIGCLGMGFRQIQPVSALRASILEAELQRQQREISLASLPPPPLPWGTLAALMTQWDALHKPAVLPQTMLSTLAHGLEPFPDIDLLRLSWTVTHGIPVADFSGKLSLNLREQRVMLDALVNRIALLPAVREVRIENRSFEGASDQPFRSDAERSDRFTLRIVWKP